MNKFGLCWLISIRKLTFFSVVSRGKAVILSKSVILSKAKNLVNLQILRFSQDDGVSHRKAMIHRGFNWIIP